VNRSAVILAVLVCAGAATLAHAQTKTEIQIQTPGYGVNVVSRTTPAVKYEHRRGSTKIDFAGTTLMPNASGIARVESKRGTMQIEAEFRGLDTPTSFGTEYLTYVLWAISPEGRAVNLGEVLLGEDRTSKLTATTDLQAFALIVTAEPYYAVRRPSDVVIQENAIRADTVGKSEAVEAKYELIDRGGYIPTGYKMDPLVLDLKLPLEFFEARNAVRIAKSAGADTYATDSYQKALDQMKQGDDLATMHHVDKKALISISREVVQTADDSREIAVKRMEADRANNEKEIESAKLSNARERSRNAVQGQKNAEAATDDANRLRAQAETANGEAQRQAERDRLSAANANQATADAQQGQRNAEADSANANQAAADANQATSDAQRGQRRAEADSANANQNAASANQATASANQAATNAQAATADAQQRQRNAEADSANANVATANAQQGQRSAEADSERNRVAAANSDQALKQAVMDREELRAKLLQQFNLIFTTRDTARGLIVNLSDVLFDTGKSTLRPGAREKLAKISGIVLAYPDLRLAIEGNTDSVGTDAANQTLSEQRANAVRDFLADEKIPTSSMTSRGLGKSQPVATNDTPEGRQQNRRVELVVSGEVIGTTIGVVALKN
jgi:outer membrane protein OmpA-like peptidoglycan-associated protein